MESFSWPQVLSWRVRRQFLDPVAGPGPVEVARRLCGVQAQVASAAELAIGLRQAAPEPGEVGRALWEQRTLMKTWAMRGTLHLLPADAAGAYLAVSGSHRRWETPAWQKAFGASPADLEAIAAAATEALDAGKALTREELNAEIVDRTGSAHLSEVLSSGWGTLLKPLAWWGVLCYGPSQGTNVTFTRPDSWLPGWRRLPEFEEAVPMVVRAYLGAHGPTTLETFNAWLSRGMTRKGLVKGWLAALEGELTTVEVEGEPMRMLAADVDELAAQRPAKTVRLLGGFDQYILGAGTNAVQIVPAERRAEVSRTAGWISPVVLVGGRVAGVWKLDNDALEITLWEKVPTKQLETEVTRVGALLGRDLRVTIGER